MATTAKEALNKVFVFDWAGLAALAATNFVESFAQRSGQRFADLVFDSFTNSGSQPGLVGELSQVAIAQIREVVRGELDELEILKLTTAVNGLGQLMVEYRSSPSAFPTYPDSANERLTVEILPMLESERFRGLGLGAYSLAVVQKLAWLLVKADKFPELWDQIRLYARASASKLETQRDVVRSNFNAKTGSVDSFGCQGEGSPDEGRFRPRGSQWIALNRDHGRIFTGVCVIPAQGGTPQQSQREREKAEEVLAQYRNQKWEEEVVPTLRDLFAAIEKLKTV